MMFAATAESAATYDLVWAAAITSGLALIGIIVTAMLARSNGKSAEHLASSNAQTAEAVAERILAELNTGNGHTAGQGIARMEETLWRHEQRLDGIEVELREAKQAIAIVEAKAEPVP